MYWYDSRKVLCGRFFYFSPITPPYPTPPPPSLREPCFSAATLTLCVWVCGCVCVCVCVHVQSIWKRLRINPAAQNTHKSYQTTRESPGIDWQINVKGLLFKVYNPFHFSRNFAVSLCVQRPKHTAANWSPWTTLNQYICMPISWFIWNLSLYQLILLTLPMSSASLTKPRFWYCFCIGSDGSKIPKKPKLLPAY